MLYKSPKPVYRKIIKRGAAVLFVAEAVAFLASYVTWSKLNNSRDYRLYMFKTCSPILEGYYQIGELFDSTSKIRQTDFNVWSQEKKI